MRLIFAALLLVLFGDAAFAATIVTSYNPPTDRVASITIIGVIEDGDFEKFRLQAENVRATPTILTLVSPGGKAFEGLKIGEYVSQHKIATIVPNGQECDSACAFIWIAGAKRIIRGSGKVGFHAVFSSDDHHEVGSGNAVVGAYYTRLGLSYDAIFMLTSAAPASMFYLTKEAALANKIDVIYPDENGVSQASQPSPPAAVSTYTSADASRDGEGRPQPSLQAPGVRYAPPSSQSRFDAPQTYTPGNITPGYQPRYAAIPAPPPAVVQAAPPRPLNEQEIETRDRLATQFVKRYAEVGVNGLNESVVACYQATQQSRKQLSALYCASLDALTYMQADVIEKQSGQPKPIFNGLDQMKDRIRWIAGIVNLDDAFLRDRAALVALDAKRTINEGRVGVSYNAEAYDRRAYCSDVAQGFAGLGLGELAFGACETLTPP